MSRNKNRTGAGLEPKRPDVSDPVIQNTNSLNFSTPTEHVDLPSRGRYYPEGYTLCNQDSIEIKYMTAKEEDILTSKNLLRKGLALERLLENVIIDKTINPSTLLVGDRNAILVAIRCTGYGTEYESKIGCPACSNNVEYMFDLSELKINHAEAEDIQDLGAKVTGEGTFIITLPVMKVDVEVRLMTGKDEKRLLQSQENKRKKKLPETLLTDQLIAIIVSVNGEEDRGVITSLIDNMPAKDTRYLRKIYDQIVPNVEMTQNFECSMCGYVADLEVPLTTDFFWPKR